MLRLRCFFLRFANIDTLFNFYSFINFNVFPEKTGQAVSVLQFATNIPADLRFYKNY